MIETVGLAMQSALENIHAGEAQRAGERARHEHLHAHAVGLAARLSSRLRRAADDGDGKEGAAALATPRKSASPTLRGALSALARF